jgi:hypothetical protein
MYMNLMKIKQTQVIEKYVRVRLYSQSAPIGVTHIDIPDNAIVDGIYIISDPGVLTHVEMDTSAGFGGYRDFECSGEEPCEFYTPAIVWRLCISEGYGGGGEGGEGEPVAYSYNSDQEIFNARITHIEAYALGASPEAYSTLLIRLLCIGECEPKIWTERRSAL